MELAPTVYSSPFIGKRVFTCNRIVGSISSVFKGNTTRCPLEHLIMSCKHTNPYFGSSRYASVVGFRPGTSKQIANAAELSVIDTLPGPTTYPQPLVLPGDDLAWDPQWPNQTLADTKKCLNRLERKPGGRQVVYVVAPPHIGNTAPKDMKNWTNLRLPKSNRTNLLQTAAPQTEDVIDYISAFYHGLPVKTLPQELQFAAWETASNKKNKKSSEFPSAIGLQTSEEVIRIRCRKVGVGPYVAQLNLNDLLDAAIAILPRDAYALLMLVEQDVYEDEDDDFCCGRAYGGSRIACVSMARYHPAADSEQDVDLEHAWPVSHCTEYIERMLLEADSEPPKKKTKETTQHNKGTKSNTSKKNLGAMYTAIDAYPKNLESMTLEAYAGLWLGRFCRTASHELGHCFGMDHCTYYACVMQGTASMAEDMRQPPYMCPVDLTKLLHTTGVTVEEHHQALLRYCSKFKDQRGALFWTPFAAWLTERLGHLRVEVP